MRKLMCLPIALTLAGVMYAGCLEPVEAQNVQCTTRPLNDSTNACASTAFVQNQLAAGLPLTYGQIYLGNISNNAASTIRPSVGVPTTPLGTVSQSTLQTAINEVAALTGGPLYVLGGAIATSSAQLNVTTNIVIEGGSASTVGSSVLTTSTAAGNLFTLATLDSVTFRDFGISNAVTRDGGTAGISCDDPSSGDPRSKKSFSNMRIGGQMIGISVADCHQFSMNDLLITPSGIGSVGVSITAVDGPDLGTGTITNTKIWNIAGEAQDAAIRWNRGSGLRVLGSRLLGAFDYGLNARLTNVTFDDGALLIGFNMIEGQDLYGVYFDRSAASQAAGRKTGQHVVMGNHIQGVTSGYQNAIGIESSVGGPWVQGAILSNNMIQNTVSSTTPMIRVDSCDGCTVIGNTIYNTAPGDAGISVGGQSTNTLIAHNNFIGTSAANRYPSTNATTTIIDHIGMTTATLPATIANGSMIWDTTTGTMKIRQGGSWLPLLGNGITTLTGDVTATGPGSVAATLATAQPGAHTWAALQQFTLGARIASGQQLDWNSDTILIRAAAADLQHGAADAASPIAQTIRAQSVVAGTSNTAGANFTIAGSRGTGTGAGGALILQVANGAGSGSSQNTLVNALRINAPATNPSSIFGGGATGALVGGAYELQVNGGAGSQVLSFGAGATLTGYFSSATTGTSFFTGGAFQLQLGVNNAGQILINSAATNVNFSITTDSSSIATGAATFAGGVGITKSLYVGSLLGLTGGQIAFPATQVPSSDVNTLDDYEEGTWTPVISAATPGDLSVAYSQQVGTYVKIGKLVTVTVQLVTSSFTYTTASGAVQITGLPFTSETLTNVQYRGTTIFSGLTKATYTQFVCTITSNVSIITMQASASAVAASSVNITDFPTAGSVIISTTISYRSANCRRPNYNRRRRKIANDNHPQRKNRKVA